MGTTHNSRNCVFRSDDRLHPFHRKIRNVSALSPRTLVRLVHRSTLFEENERTLHAAANHTSAQILHLMGLGRPVMSLGELKGERAYALLPDTLTGEMICREFVC